VRAGKVQFPLRSRCFQGIRHIQRGDTANIDFLKTTRGGLKANTTRLREMSTLSERLLERGGSDEEGSAFSGKVTPSEDD